MRRRSNILVNVVQVAVAVKVHVKVHDHVNVDLRHGNELRTCDEWSDGHVYVLILDNGEGSVQALLQSGVLIDVALGVTLLECVALVWLHKRGKGIPPSAIAGQLLAGVMLLLALRCALRGADYRWTLAFFSASLPAHLFDLQRRYRWR